jgi:hypothetical protein
MDQQIVRQVLEVRDLSSSVSLHGHLYVTIVHLPFQPRYRIPCVDSLTEKQACEYVNLQSEYEYRMFFESTLTCRPTARQRPQSTRGRKYRRGVFCDPRGEGAMERAIHLSNKKGLGFLCCVVRPTYKGEGVKKHRVKGMGIEWSNIMRTTENTRTRTEFSCRKEIATGSS